MATYYKVAERRKSARLRPDSKKGKTGDLFERWVSYPREPTKGNGFRNQGAGAVGPGPPAKIFPARL